jgi:hypothetical protein
MTERKNVKFDKESYELLKEHKHKHENWNHFAHRVHEVLSEHDE